MFGTQPCRIRHHQNEHRIFYFHRLSQSSQTNNLLVSSHFGSLTMRPPFQRAAAVKAREGIARNAHDLNTWNKNDGRDSHKANLAHQRCRAEANERRRAARMVQSDKPVSNTLLWLLLHALDSILSLWLLQICMSLHDSKSLLTHPHFSPQMVFGRNICQNIAMHDESDDLYSPVQGRTLEFSSSKAKIIFTKTIARRDVVRPS
jgi:hypothetical protein